MISYLVQQLRESCPYLEDQGWTDTAELMNAAANEIEQLMIKTRSLEDRLHERKRSPPASTPWVCSDGSENGRPLRPQHNQNTR
jgi:hypothetical protein